jgi:serine/threonine-protein kinase
MSLSLKVDEKTMDWDKLRHFIIALLTHRSVKLVGSIAALFLALALTMDWVIMPIYTKHGEGIEVPNITSLRYEDAKRTLEENGFKIIQSEERYDSHYPMGYVLEQIPRPHVKVKSGRRIYVVVSRGGRRVMMPQLVDRSQRDAELLLAKNNLVLGQVNYEFSNLQPEGVIITQSVPANADIGEGTSVDITISSGKEPSQFIVPLVEGRIFDDAVRMIRQAGLAVGQITYTEVEDLLPETVIHQFTEAGTVVEKGTKIDLEVSKVPSSTSNNHQ